MTTNDPLELAFSYAQFTRRNIFLTGKAGTGKTTFLRRLKASTYKRMIVVAPTGVAAINAGGVTIHSFFQLAPGLFLPGGAGDGERRNKYSYSRHKINILRSIDLLVIDEVSMVRADLLDAVDDVLRRYQDRCRPFGGVQLLLIGDLQQLAPVTSEAEWPLLSQYYPTPYFFDSLALKQTNYTTIELTHVFRQADPTFIDILNDVREGHPSPETLRRLNERYNPTFRPRDDEGYITLTTHNYQAQEINKRRLDTLPAKAEMYRARITGDFPQMAFPTDEELVLKVGAQVMFCKNDPSPEKQYYNGKIGRVVALNKEFVTVECPEENDPSQTMSIVVGAQEWTNAKYVTDEESGQINEEITGTYSQIPLKTAWAITIHKSQGLTFEHAIINAGQAFSHGQVYVALSRCRSLEGLVLSTPVTASVISTDPSITLYNRFMEQNHPDAAQLVNDERLCVEELLGDLFDFTAIDTRLRYFKRLCDEHLSKLYPNYTARVEEMQLGVEHELREVGLRFRTQIHQLMPAAEDYDHNDALQERVGKAVGYYLRRTAELMGDFFVAGLPDIGNKKTAEQLQREFDLMKSDYDLKMALFLSCSKGGFSLRDYWDTKAKATMQQAEGKPAKAKKSTAKAAAVNLAADKVDILNPELYDRLHAWRRDKAADNSVAAYQVLSNKALLGVVNSLPRTEKELLAVPGLGKKLVAAYGAELLEMVRQYRKK